MNTPNPSREDLKRNLAMLEKEPPTNTAGFFTVAYMVAVHRLAIARLEAQR
jgi:hypothetical protein